MAILQSKDKADYHQYRDDRKFVMNLHPSGKGRWELITYRNTGSLPSVRTDDFQSFEVAKSYVKRVEPQTPLISNSEAPLDLIHLPTEEERYQFFLRWLLNKRLFSTLKLHLHCPYWHDERGWTEKRAAVRVKPSKFHVDGVGIELTETSFPLREQ